MHGCAVTALRKPAKRKHMPRYSIAPLYLLPKQSVFAGLYFAMKTCIHKETNIQAKRTAISPMLSLLNGLITTYNYLAVRDLIFIYSLQDKA